MNVTHLDDLPYKEMMPGLKVKFVHSENMTFAFWEIEQDVELPKHSHHHEQVVNVLDGHLELKVEKETYNLSAGDILAIPSNAEHSAVAHKKCKVLDTFYPVREDYLNS